MQEAIISKEEWLRVQELRKNRCRHTATGKNSLFSGLIYCADCGAKLHFCAAKSLKPNQEFYRCANYKSGRGNCTIHFIRNVILERIVLEAISDLSDFVRCYEPVFLYMFENRNAALKKAEHTDIKNDVKKGEQRIKELDRLIEKIYEDKVSGKLSEEHCSKMINNFETEQKDLIKEVSEKQKALDSAEQKNIDLRLLLRTLREQTDIKELTPALVNSLIQRIEVHNKEKINGHSHVRVDIYFTAIGMIDIPTKKEIEKIMKEIKNS